MARINQSGTVDVTTDPATVPDYEGVTYTKTSNSITATLPSKGGGYYGVEILNPAGQLLRRVEQGGSGSPGTITVSGLAAATQYKARAYFADSQEGNV